MGGLKKDPIYPDHSPTKFVNLCHEIARSGLVDRIKEEDLVAVVTVKTQFRLKKDLKYHPDRRVDNTGGSSSIFLLSSSCISTLLDSPPFLLCVNADFSEIFVILTSASPHCPVN